MSASSVKLLRRGSEQAQPQRLPAYCQFNSPLTRAFSCLHFTLYYQYRHKEAKDMATKKKVEQPISDELQQILDHFGENSAEYRFALMQIEPTKILHIPSEVSKESIDNLLAAKTDAE